MADGTNARDSVTSRNIFPHQSKDGDARPGPDEDDVPAEEVADLPRLLTHAGVLGAGERALAVRQDPEHDVEHPEGEGDDGGVPVQQREEETDCDQSCRPQTAQILMENITLARVRFVM